MELNWHGPVELTTRVAYDNDRGICNEVAEGDTYRLRDLARELRGRRLKTVVDCGAHVGAFTKFARSLFGNASFACYEVNPLNLSTLRRNVGAFADVELAAITVYERAYLLDSIGRSRITGGSVVRPNADEAYDERMYDRTDPGAATLTLDDLVELHGCIDLLKLDVEGCECGLIRESTRLDDIGYVVGEWHGRADFLDACDGLTEREVVLRMPHVGEDLGTFTISPRDGYWERAV